ncbi:hypothetical protein BDR22DRAFT_921707 [Usnea florida]
MMGEAVTSSKTMPKYSLSPAPGHELPTSKAPTPLGRLGILPRELRDEIYRHLCNQDYHFDGVVLPCREWTPTGHSSTWPSIRNMVTVSTAIRRELLAIFHANAVFEFDVPIGRVSKTRTRNDIPFVDHIKNVRWIIYLWVMSDTSCNKYNIPYEHLNQRISELTSGISLFTGPDISRKSCVIELQFCTPRAIQILQSPFFNGIKLLTGFKTVEIKLLAEKKDWCPKDALTYGGESESFRDRAAGFKMFQNAVLTALEPSLGPSIVTGWNGQTRFNLTWELTFHPSDYVQSKKSEAMEIVP